MAGYRRALRIVVNGLALLSLLLSSLPVLQVAAAPPPGSGASAKNNLSLRDWRSAYSSLRPSSAGSSPSSASGIESDLAGWRVNHLLAGLSRPIGWGEIASRTAGEMSISSEEDVRSFMPLALPVTLLEWSPLSAASISTGDDGYPAQVANFSVLPTWQVTVTSTATLTSSPSAEPPTETSTPTASVQPPFGFGTSTTSEFWLNNGTGTLTFTRSFALNCADMAPDNLDGDGDLDAVVRGIGASSRFWLNDGSGVFTLTQSLTGSDTFSWSLDLGDLDGNGDLDAFMVNEGDDAWMFSYSEVWLNDGSRVFTLAQSVANAQSTAVDLGNVDGDNDLDAFLGTNFGGNLVWENLGRPLWAVIRAEPGTALVEQQTIRVTMWVTNISGVAVDDVQPWLGADDTHLVSGPQPVSATLGVGESITFTLTYTASESGTIIWQGGATGVDTTSGITAMSPSTVSNAVSVVGTGQAWIQRQPATSPSARDEAALVYDSDWR